jgi:hypothetical protein
MKKLILLSLMTMGVGLAGTSAQAGGVAVFVSSFRVPVFVPPPPIFAPAIVLSTGCARPVVVGGPVYAPCYRPAPCYPVVYRGGFDHRPVICRDGHFRR